MHRKFVTVEKIFSETKKNKMPVCCSRVISYYQAGGVQKQRNYHYPPLSKMSENCGFFHTGKKINQSKRL